MTKLKIVLWDFSKNAVSWMDENVCMEKVCVEKHLLGSDDIVNETLSCEWDYIFCFLPNEAVILRQKFADIFQRLNISDKQVVYALDLADWVAHCELGNYVLADGELKKRMTLHCEKQGRDFITCTVEGISYVAGTTDRVILDWMYLYDRNWADEEMQMFYQMAQKYYGIEPSKKGYFLDIGANIGTTCIYFKKKIDPSVTILAFEPEEKNYRLLQTNLTLNNLSAESICENYGLSEQSEEQILYVNKANPGQNSVLLDYGQEKENIDMVSLDDYLQNKGILPQDIKYIWIDTEGFEPMVIAGAGKTLQNGRIPVFMELNPYLWNAAGMYEKLMQVLTGIYQKYLIIDEVLEGQEVLHDIEELWQYREAPQFWQHDIFLIKE